MNGRTRLDGIGKYTYAFGKNSVNFGRSWKVSASLSTGPIGEIPAKAESSDEEPGMERLQRSQRCSKAKRSRLWLPWRPSLSDMLAR